MLVRKEEVVKKSGIITVFSNCNREHFGSLVALLRLFGIMAGSLAASKMERNSRVILSTNIQHKCNHIISPSPSSSHMSHIPLPALFQIHGLSLH